MTFFKPITFSLNFASPFSVMTHNFSEMFYLKQFILWTKKAYQSTIFQTFEYSNKSSLDFSCHFCPRSQGQGLSKFCMTGQCLERQLLCIFLAQIFGQKEPIKVKFLDF